MLQIYTNPMYTFLKAVLGRTDKGVIWLQKNTGINATGWKQERRILCNSYRKILISAGNLLCKQTNYFINSLLFDSISNPAVCIQDTLHVWQCSWLHGITINMENTLASILFNSTNIFLKEIVKVAGTFTGKTKTTFCPVPVLGSDRVFISQEQKHKPICAGLKHQLSDLLFS